MISTSLVYASSTPINNSKFYFSFDTPEIIGSTYIDASNHSFHAVAYNAILNSTNAVANQSIFNSQKDGDNHYINLNMSAAPLHSSEGLSFSFWINYSSTANTGAQNFFLMDYTKNEIIRFFTDDQGNISFDVFTEDGYRTLVTSSLNNSGWHHIAGTCKNISNLGLGSDFNISLYVDGVMFQSLLVRPFGTNPTYDHFKFGGWSGIFNASFDEAGFYNYSLSQEQVSKLYTTYNPYTPYVPSTSTLFGSVSLVSPPNDNTNSSTSINFTYSVLAENSTISNCSLLINGILNQTNSTPVVNNSNNNFSGITLQERGYNWSMSCFDSNLNSYNTTNWSLTISRPILTVYTNNTYNSTPFGYSSVFITKDDGWTTNFSMGINTSQNISLDEGNYYVFFNNSKYFSRNYSVTIDKSYTNLTYNTYGSMVNFVANVIVSGSISNFSVNLTDTVTGVSVFRTATSNTSFELNGNVTYNYTYILYSEGFPSTNGTGSVTTGYRSNTTINLSYPFSITSFFYDEKTLETFNISAVDSLYMYAFCSNQTIIQQMKNYTANITIACTFTKLKFVVTQGTSTYYRTMKFESGGSLANLSVYLINTITTDYIYNSFQLDDIFGSFANPSIWIYKTLPSGKTLIHSDDIDAEGKVAAYLISNDEYSIEIKSSNNPIQVMGAYSADLSGIKLLKLYQVGINPSGGTNFFSRSRYGISSFNVNGSDLAFLSYYDESSNTDDITWTLRAGSTTGTVLYSSSYPNTNEMDVYLNISQFTNNTYTRIYSVATFTQDGKTYQDTRLLWGKNNTLSKLPNALENSLGLSKNWLGTFLLIFLCVIALGASAVNQNFAGFGIILLCAVFAYFGWFAMAGIILGFLVLIVLLNLWFEGKERMG